MPNPGSDTVPKGLLPVELPRTVLDAVQAVLRLGLQYLWVDKYCIDQDDAAGLESQIAIMDTVYHLADVTIVVACGKDASFGLPGIGLTRRREQPIINLDGRVLASCLHDPIEIIRRSKWNTRGGHTKKAYSRDAASSSQTSRSTSNATAWLAWSQTPPAIPW